MSAISLDALVDKYAPAGARIIRGSDDVVAPADSSTEIVAAPSAGRFLIAAIAMNVNTAGLLQFYHTAVTGGNELTGQMTAAAGVPQILAFTLPTAASLWVVMTTANGRGIVDTFTIVPRGVA